MTGVQTCALPISAAGLVGMMSGSDRALQRVLAIVLRAALGFALAAPLWAYLEIIKRHAAMGG